MKATGILRFVLAVALIGLTAILLQARGRTEIIPKHRPFSSFPPQLGNWEGTEVALDKETLEVLGAGDFMERVYQDPDGKLPEVDLFLAYFATQRAGKMASGFPEPGLAGVVGQLWLANGTESEHADCPHSCQGPERGWSAVDKSQFVGGSNNRRGCAQRRGRDAFL